MHSCGRPQTVYAGNTLFPLYKKPKKGKTKHYAEWKAEHKGKPTWRGLIREDVDKNASMTFTHLTKHILYCFLEAFFNHIIYKVFADCCIFR